MESQQDASGVTEREGAYKIPALRALSEITTSLAGESDLEELLDRFLGTMIRLSGAQAGAVRILSDDGTHLRLIGSRGLPSELLKPQCEIDVDCGVCGDALRLHSVNSCSNMTICLEKGAPEWARFQWRKVVPVPLLFKGRAMGVYNLYFATERTVPDDVALLFKSIGDHLGMALENARLTRENMRVTLVNERQMLASEIHDSLAQTMAFMKMRLALLQEAVEDGDCERSFGYMNEVSEALDSAYASLRELLSQFRNRMDPCGLLPALKDLTEAFTRRTGLAIELRNRVPDPHLNPGQEVQVFHIVQEALANIQKHASAQDVVVEIATEGEHYVVTVQDNGVGMDTSGSPPPMHFGLSIMRERAQRLGGTIAYTSRPGVGTTVRLAFPAAKSTLRPRP